MSSDDIVLLLVAVALVVLAGLFASAEAALSAYSTVRADERVEQGVRGAERLRRLLQDPPRSGWPVRSPRSCWSPRRCPGRSR
jgi:magnesium and cobalt exporter, CNNM family